MSRRIVVEVCRDGEVVDRKELDQDVIKIGKIKSSHVFLEDDSVARMHAVVEVSGKDIRLVDLGSASGTLLNGNRVERHATLQAGDRIGVGQYELRIATLAEGNAAVAVAPTPMPPPQRPPAPIDAADVEVHGGRTVAEVITQYGNTVLDVQHVGQVRRRRGSAALLLAGGAAVLAGLALFGYDATRDWEGHRSAVAQAQVSGRPAPAEPGTGMGALGMGLALCGLIPFAAGAVRRGDKFLGSYTIGETGQSAFATPTEGIGDSSHALVRGSEHGEQVLAFTPQMSGEVFLGGQRATLAELASTGRAAPSGNGYAYPMPAGARARVNYGPLTFHVNSVAPGKQIAGRGKTDAPFWLYSAASLGVIGSLLVLAHLLPDDAMDMNLDDLSAESRYVGYMNQPDDIPEEEQPPTVDDAAGEAGGDGTRHDGDEGQMGDSRSKQQRKLYSMKGPMNAIPHMARNYDADLQARSAGILGMIEQESGHFLASPYGEAFALGNEDEDVFGGLTGTDVGSAFGMGGLGLIGTGRGGGGNGEGTIGWGTTGLIGKGAGGGNGSNYGRGSGAGFGPRKKRVPRVRQPKPPIIRGAVDKDVIRRIVRNHINEVRHCYNQGLTKDPNLKGRVAVQFSIGPTGRVKLAVIAESSLKDRNVANCIAGAVKRWKFPRPDSGGHVLVTYPFALSPG